MGANAMDFSRELELIELRELLFVEFLFESAQLVLLLRHADPIWVQSTVFDTRTDRIHNAVDDVELTFAVEELVATMKLEKGF